MTMPEFKEGNRVCRRSYIRIEGELASPLLAGSGEDNLTDMDVILDEKGLPFIPGSTLAGASRQHLAEVSGNEAANYLFGGPRAGRESRVSIEDDRQSRLFVYDTKLVGARLCKRDGVRLDEFKTAEDKAKYEMQIVERGAGYVIRLEFVEREDDLKWSEATVPAERLGAVDGMQHIRTLLTGLNRGEVTLGAKSRRGFGRLNVQAVRVKQFEMTKPEEHLAWLDWDWINEDAFDGAEIWDLKQIEDTIKQNDHCLRVPLKVRNTIMIRKYVGESPYGSVLPDYVQLKSAGKAVVPGTSWMGAIRARLETILRNINRTTGREEIQRKLEPVFGTWSAECKTEQTLLASVVKVEESLLQEGYGLPLTRNAIDRFTGGTVQGALYTGIPWVGGHTELVLRWPCKLDKVLSDGICGLLLWAVSDLQSGLLAVGGETAVGRGTFEAAGDITLDGNLINDRKLYYKAAMNWCKR